MESDRITLPKEKLIITSINRYERKKGIAVGLKAIKLLKNQYGGKTSYRMPKNILKLKFFKISGD